MRKFHYSTRPSDERIKEAQADINKLLNALKFATTTPPTAQKTDDYGLVIQQQSLRDVTRLNKTFNPGNDLNQFTILNKASTIHVIRQLAIYPSLEAEFIKAAKDLLDHGIFQQMVDSK